jgi:hypothetical protein
MYVLERDVKERRRECKIMNNTNLCRYLVDSCTAWARLECYECMDEVGFCGG